MLASPFRLPRVTPFGVGEAVVEWATGLAKLERLYQQRPSSQSSFEFMRYTLDALNIDYAIAKGSLENIPKDGPVVIVANHPLGAIEGVILADLIGQVRSDVKVLANEMLKRLPEIRDLFIGVAESPRNEPMGKPFEKRIVIWQTAAYWWCFLQAKCRPIRKKRRSKNRAC